MSNITKREQAILDEAHRMYFSDVDRSLPSSVFWNTIWGLAETIDPLPGESLHYHTLILLYDVTGNKAAASYLDSYKR